MKVKQLQKLKLTKATISQINQKISMQLKGGTRQGDTGLGNSGMATQCGDIVCY
ncbi:hypothetical protein IMCC3317_33730 [Kordia antarctica]|uniref:Uncharacterized protein n=1 Tax=Kordia antarctica TaxID=1218801 RepID=A0A7L4ZNB1_9FLAO|nr:hypothetical protein [Kordia antarctica]QHI37990.1 hypothetical protein IMCC3317_33730 [Kordia antarctica]